MVKQKNRLKEWCDTERNKTDDERRACHALFYGKDAKLPKRKFKRRKW